MKKTKIMLAVGAVLGLSLVGCNESKTTDVSVSTDTAVQAMETKQASVEVEQPMAHQSMTVETPKASFEVLEGTHYEVLDESIEVPLFDGTVISEFFWLGCPHCQRFEPLVHQWKDDLVASGVNTIISKNAVPSVNGNGLVEEARWTFDSKVYYTMKELNATDEQVSDMLKLYEIYAAKMRSYPQPEDIKEFFITVKLDGDKALEIMESDIIKEKMLKSNTEFEKTGASGVPVFVINGKYKIKFDNIKSDNDINVILQHLSQKK